MCTLFLQKNAREGFQKVIKLDNFTKIKYLFKAYVDYPISDIDGFRVQHPFHNTSILAISDGTKLTHFNCLTDEKSYSIWKQTLKDQIENSKSVNQLFFYLMKPYRMQTLVYFYELGLFDDLTILAPLLKSCWSTQEFPNWNERHHLAKIREIFSLCKDFIMDEDERKYYDSLPDEITIFRGQYNNYRKVPYRALSWTTSFDTAAWFKNHRYTNGKIYEAKINKNDTYAYLNNRGEHELIVNFNKIYDIQEIKEVPDEEH